MTEAGPTLGLEDSGAPATLWTAEVCSWKQGAGQGQATPWAGIDCLFGLVEGCDRGGEAPTGRWDGVFVGGPEAE